MAGCTPKKPKPKKTGTKTIPQIKRDKKAMLDQMMREMDK